MSVVRSADMNKSPARERAWIETNRRILLSESAVSPARERAWIETTSRVGTQMFLTVARS